MILNVHISSKKKLNKSLNFAVVNTRKLKSNHITVSPSLVTVQKRKLYGMEVPKHGSLQNELF